MVISQICSFHFEPVLRSTFWTLFDRPAATPIMAGHPESEPTMTWETEEAFIRRPSSYAQEGKATDGGDCRSKCVLDSRNAGDLCTDDLGRFELVWSSSRPKKTVFRGILLKVSIDYAKKNCQFSAISRDVGRCFLGRLRQVGADAGRSSSANLLLILLSPEHVLHVCG